MFRIFIGAIGLLDMGLCLVNYCTSKDVPLMIVEAMFGMIFYLTFLLTEEGDDDYYVQDARRAQT